MMFYFKKAIRRLLLFIIIALSFYSLDAQDSNLVGIDSGLVDLRGSVKLEEDTLFFLYESSATISARERAGLANQRIRSIANLPKYDKRRLKLKDTLDGVFILYDSLYIIKITALDALGEGLEDKRLVAKNSVLKINGAIEKYRATKGFAGIIREIAISIAVLLIFIIVVFITNRLFRYLKWRLVKSSSKYLNGLRIKKYELLGKDRMHSLVIFVLNVFRILFLVVVFYITLPLILNLFPWTEGIAEMLIDFVLDPLKDMVRGIVDYIPSLFTIILIFLLVRFFVRGINHIAGDIKTEKLSLPGFYPDWAVPTARLLSVLLYAFMFVIIWPYLPGSDSPAFKGITVFLGLLVTLGSSSAIANIVSGMVITYMRPYQVGHRVRIGEVVGDVVEKNLLVTRIKTIKNEIVTVPNSKVMAGESINFSLSSNEHGGLIINSEVTIGYDVNWRLVHRLLKDAAAKTPLIKKDPPPFVLQTALDDFYVRYQINAYTESPQDQAAIYSDLHALIQDEFAKAGVEIMSPHFRANRDGESTIPELPSNNRL